MKCGFIYSKFHGYRKKDKKKLIAFTKKGKYEYTLELWILFHKSGNITGEYYENGINTDLLKVYYKQNPDLENQIGF